MKLTCHASTKSSNWSPPQKFAKLRFIMRFQLIVGVLLSLFIQVSGSTYAQRVSLQVKNKTLSDVFEQVAKQTGYVFLYDDRSFTEKKISLAVQNEQVEEVLEACLTDLPISYKIVERNIIFKQDESKRILAATPQQPEQVTGRITDSLGNPLQGVTVMVKGTTRGATTNAAGNFQIAASGCDVLVFTLVGYQCQEVTLDG